jgi:protoporphyrinogen/coproporphyrinogen III oxidase
VSAHRVVVVGGGLAGLFTASELVAAGVDDVVVLEQASLPGGVARTIQRDGYSLEPAAGTLLLPHPHLSDVLGRLGAEVLPAEAAAALRYVYTGGRLVTLASSPKALAAPLVPFPAKARAAAEPFIRSRPATPDESLDAFLRRRLGGGLGGMLASLAASGVFAGDPTRLSARSSFPLFPALEDEAGSIVRGGLRRARSRRSGGRRTRPTGHLPVGGMQGVVRAAVSRLGDRLRSGRQVTAVRPDGAGWAVEDGEILTAEHLVLAIPPDRAAGLVGGDLGEVLRRAVTAPVVVLGLGGPAGRFPLPAGFGALIGPDAGMVTLGILFESSYAPERAPAGHSLAKVIAGGAQRPELVKWDDARLVETIGAEVARALGSDLDVSYVEVVRHPAGIPQYEVGHGDWLTEVDRLRAARPGLHLTGWGYRGVGVAHVATDAVRTAGEIAGVGG